jgi:hypothetical protein
MNNGLQTLQSGPDDNQTAGMFPSIDNQIGNACIAIFPAPHRAPGKPKNELPMTSDFVCDGFLPDHETGARIHPEAIISDFSKWTPPDGIVACAVADPCPFNRNSAKSPKFQQRRGGGHEPVKSRAGADFTANQGGGA